MPHPRWVLVDAHGRPTGPSMPDQPFLVFPDGAGYALVNMERGSYDARPDGYEHP